MFDCRASRRITVGEPFPLVLECRSPASLAGRGVRLGCATAESELLTQAAEHGAILFRGFPLTTPEDFDAFVAAFESAEFSVRRVALERRADRQDAARLHRQRSPADVNIYLPPRDGPDADLSRRSCSSSASSRRPKGGATPLCRSDMLWERLAERCPQFAARLRSEGPQVHERDADRERPDLRHGPQLAEHAARRHAAKRPRRGCAASATRGSGCPTAACGRRRRCCPPCESSPDGRTTFFNQLIAAFQGWKDTRNDPSKAITFGDGTPLDRDAVNVATRAGRGAGVRRAVAARRRGPRR